MRRTILLLLTLVLATWGYGQKFAVKTNALYWATATPNLGVEFGVGERVTIGLEGGYNPFTFSDYRKWKHYLIEPEVRYWLCERFNGHFFGLHTGFVEYNVAKLPLLYSKQSRHLRYEGWLTGVGVSYGYQWILGGRWNLEAELGVGYIHTNYKRFIPGDCGEYQGRYTKNYFAPTKLAVSIVYLIK